MTEEIKRMDLTEFRDLGFLQEANRLFFHPLGLALEVNGEWIEDEEGNKKFIVDSLGGIWDYRDDSEGMLFDSDAIDIVKMKTVGELWKSKVQERIKTGLCLETGIQQPTVILDMRKKALKKLEENEDGKVI